MANGNQQDFSPQGIQNRILAGASPLFRQGAQAVRQAAGGAARRRGVFGAGDISRQATEPLGQALGQTALRAGETGERMGAEFEKQRRSLEQQLTLQRESLAQQKELEQARLQEMIAQRQQQAQLQFFPQTGFTPQLAELTGLQGEGGFLGGPTAFRGLQREVGRLGLPGQPFGQQGFGQQGFGGGLGAGMNLQLQRMFPGMSRGMRLQNAMNMGLIPGGIQPGQFQR